MVYNPQESLENTTNTMGTLVVGVHPSERPLTRFFLDSHIKPFNQTCAKALWNVSLQVELDG